MSEKPGISDQYRMASPWPVFVALGFALAEVGIFLGIFPVAVGGVLLFGGTIAGILTEAGYVTNLWKTTMLVGGGLLVLGVALVILQGQFGTDAMMAAIDSPNTVGHRLLSRGLAIVSAAIVLVAVGVTQIGRYPTR